MILTDGKILKNAIALSDYKIDEIVDITGISKGQLYNLYKEEIIKDTYKERLKKLKLDLVFSPKITNEDEKQDYKNKYVELLEKRNMELEKENVSLKDKHEKSVYSNSTLENILKNIMGDINEIKNATLKKKLA